MAARVAVAGALVVVPLAAVAGPALASTTTSVPSATAVDWHGGPDWDRPGLPGPGRFPGGPGGFPGGLPGPGFPHGWDHGWNHGGPGWNPGPWAPPTGSAG